MKSRMNPTIGKKILIALSILLAVLTLVLLLRYFRGERKDTDSYSDGITQIDLNRIRLESSGVEVHFSDVILSQPQETRKLVVLTRDAQVEVELTDRLIDVIDFDFMKKTQTIQYSGTGYFVVSLDSLTEADIVTDDANHTVILYIDHAYLEALDINPSNIMIAEVNESLLARGDIKMSVSDYNALEQQIRDRMVDRMNTVTNGQVADQTALDMVRAVYEPVVEAVNPRYSVDVRFR